jgi:hypothetical protein
MIIACYTYVSQTTILKNSKNRKVRNIHFSDDGLITRIISAIAKPDV